MPKTTFYNLSDEKKEKIIEALKKEFEEKSLFEANVSDIIKYAGISRGSFYQYFEDLEDSFFTILDIELVEIHDVFMSLVKKEKGDFIKALKLYGPIVSKEIYRKGNYNLYKNRYLYWNCELDEKWKKFREQAGPVHKGHPLSLISGNLGQKRESMYFIKAVIKSLLERLFFEEWTEEEFLSNYNLHVDWIEKGIDI